MSNTIRIKRRLDTLDAAGEHVNVAGAPSVGSLLNAELAFNEVDNTLYYGEGDNGSGVATSIIPIGGNGYIARQIENAQNSLNSSLTALSADMIIRDNALTDAVEGYTRTAISELVDGAPGALDTLKEFADALKNGDSTYAVHIATSVETLGISATDHADRINTLEQASSDHRVGILEVAFDTLTGASGVVTLGTIASQNKGNVDITGGKVKGLSELAATDASFQSASAVSLSAGSAVIGSLAAQDAVMQSVSAVSLSSAQVSITGGAISGASLDSNDVNLTGGDISGVTLSSYSVTITGGTLVGTSVSDTTVSNSTLTGCTMDAGTF